MVIKNVSHVISNGHTRKEQWGAYNTYKSIRRAVHRLKLKVVRGTKIEIESVDAHRSLYYLCISSHLALCVVYLAEIVSRRIHESGNKSLKRLREFSNTKYESIIRNNTFSSFPQV